MKVNKLLAAASVAALAIGLAAAPADATTNASASWNGAGVASFNANATNGSTFGVSTGSNNSIVGSASYSNDESNPYGYGVPNTASNFSAAVGGGGTISSSVTRDGSGSGYGAAGQSITSFIGTTDGTGAAVGNVKSSYAGLSEVDYGMPKTAGNNVLNVSGSSYELDYSVNTGVVAVAGASPVYNSSGLSVTGNGSAAFNQNYSSASASGYSMANGGGIFTTATLTGTGNGSFSYGGVGTASVSIPGANLSVPGTVTNPGSLTVTGTWDGALNLGNVAVNGTVGH